MGEMRNGTGRGAFTFTRSRVIAVIAVIVLAAVGVALPYLTLGYEDFASQPIRPTHSLWPAGDMLRRLSLGYLTAGPNAGADQLGHGLDVITAGTSIQQIAVVVAVITVVGLCRDEINKFFWWPLHLSGWLFVAGATLLFVGAALWRGLEVDVVVGPGWVPLVLDGGLILVLTFRSWHRIDSYRGL